MLASPQTSMPSAPALSIGIIGAGVMGRGIAETAASHGIETVLLDVDERVGREALAEIRSRVRGSSLMGRQSVGTPAQVLARIHFTTSYDALATCSLVVENVTEDVEVKGAVYREMEDWLRDDAILAANTSTFPITELANLTANPERVVGLHFMNPPSSKTFVEVIPGLHTSAATVERALQYLAALGCTGILVKDSPGFVSNRILMMVVNEAVGLVEAGIASIDDVDRIFVGCFGHAMGPLATADLIGLDTIVLSLESLQVRLDDSRYEPRPLLRRLVADNRLGRKTNGGFYAY